MERTVSDLCARSVAKISLISWPRKTLSSSDVKLLTIFVVPSGLHNTRKVSETWKFSSTESGDGKVWQVMELHRTGSSWPDGEPLGWRWLLT